MNVNENRKIYIADEVISLSEYIESTDDLDCYNCWCEKKTQEDYNSKFTDTFEEFSSQPINQRFLATIVNNVDDIPIGSIWVSPEGVEPDISLIIYKPYRGMGFESRALALGLKYWFEVLKMKFITAGCYPHDVVSMKILADCGFVRDQKNDSNEKHYLTGEDIIQYVYVKNDF